MTRDYKRTERRGGGRGSGHSLLVGILIGLVLGLGIALGVAWYINKAPSPFLTRTPPAAEKPAPAAVRPDEKSIRSPDAKPRFDFYKILPGVDEPATEQQLKEAQKRAPATAKETFFLQAGAFQNASDADNMKARLALLGVEATVQTASVPDKGVWHRVRIGPYTSVEQLNQTRETLKHNGVETTLVKVRSGG